MMVLLLVLWVIGILLLVILALALVILVLPARVEVRWQPKIGWRFWLAVGPYRHRFSLPELPQSFQTEKKEKQQERPAPEESAGRGGEPSGSDGGMQQPDTPKKPDAAPKPAAEQKPSNPQNEMDLLYEKVMSNPVHYVRLFQHWARQTGGFLLRHLRVRKVCIVWTVTGESAASTAIQYGAAMAACNTAWAILKDFVDIRAENLHIEPDFTGKQAEKRCFACQITARMYIIMASIYLTVRTAASHRKKRTKQ